MKTTIFPLTFLAAFLAPQILNGMESDSLTGFSKEDSLSIYHIDEVIIQQPRTSFFQKGKKVTETDSLTLSVFFDGDLGKVLNSITPAYINARGGKGSSAGLVLRGTNSYQTTVKWNGFNLNSLTLGSTDLSTVPVEGMGSVKIIHGSSGTVSGSGSFGGSVELTNKPDWNNRLDVNLTTGYGSFNTKRGSATGRAGNENIQYHFNIFREDALNDFSYIDRMKSGNPEVTIANNALENTGFIQNIFARLPGNNKIEAGFWYQNKVKEIPSVMGLYEQGNALQRDSIMRGYVKWSKTFDHSRLNLSSSLMSEHMRYREESAPEESSGNINNYIAGKKFFNEVDYRLYLNNYITLDAGASYNSLQADVEQYGETAKENRTALFSGVRVNYMGLTTNFTLRKEFHPEVSIPPLFSAGIQYNPPDTDVAFKFSYSDQFRVPTFNDKYWQPGGNPSLLPESGHTIDAGVQGRFSPAPGHSVNAELSVYRSDIENMIQWVPGEGYWSPENKKEVGINGLEASLDYTTRLKDLKLDFEGSYGFSSPRIKQVHEEESSITGNRMEYVPAHTANARIMMVHEKAHAGISVNYTGSRYTTRDNNPVYEMPPFTLFNLYGGYSLQLHDFKCTLQIRAMNILNKQYQVVRGYPMPGRSLHASLKVGFSR